MGLGTVGGAAVPRDGKDKTRSESPWVIQDGWTTSRVDLLSLVPLAAILALVALIGAFVWVVDRGEAEQLRTKLATDALWVEQTLRFQLSVDEDMLARLALDAAGGGSPDILEARERLHIASNPEVLSIVWYDAGGKVIRAVPGLPDPEDAALPQLILRSGKIVSRPIYGDIAGDTVTLGLAIAGGGVVTATISLPLLLERHIPWWIAEQYGVRLADTGGNALAVRARRALDATAPSHSIAFDPPLRGTVLTITPYKRPAGFLDTLLIAVIASLALFAIFALLTLQRSARRRRRAEKLLQGEIAFRHSMEESLTVGLRAKDHEGRILYVNSAFCKLVDWPAEDLVGHLPPMPYWAPERMQETLDRQMALAQGHARPQAFETGFRRRDGTMIDVQVFEAPLIDAGGVHRGWMGSVIDMTDVKRAARAARLQDEAMARTGRLVTLGEMASTLAHELNQPLSAIAGYATGALNLLDQGQTDGVMMRLAVEKVAAQAGRAGQIIRRIQDLVKKREPRLDPLSLPDVIIETVGFLAAEARELRVSIETALHSAPPVRADGILIQQVLINLIRNGMEAMAEGRRHGDMLRVTLDTTAEGDAQIEVADLGHGIEPALADHVFDAFTSTKPHGMGMGLNICRTLVELHRGQLTFRRGREAGTIFTVILPALAKGSEQAAE
ncbi:PAS domain-containing sensor histidine kinase [Zavarzinia aquatilis]|uniref:histidine kinase n=2 Tax=Zavarzinia aquatilis TaxID=2211142 RepID=A0A317EG48_9PROT|nr:PAS domain-containing sensor histidine kinase [Zavarzinia aquatilis]